MQQNANTALIKGCGVPEDQGDNVITQRDRRTVQRGPMQEKDEMTRHNVGSTTALWEI